MRPKVVCPYCGKDAELIDSEKIYGRSYGMVWSCGPCDAYVGVHKNSKHNIPLGRLANKELREWKMRAHAAFDPLCLALVDRGEVKKKARNRAYGWLAGKLGLTRDECHIGRFNVEQCREVVRICSEVKISRRRRR